MSEEHRQHGGQRRRDFLKSVGAAVPIVTGAGLLSEPGAATNTNFNPSDQVAVDEFCQDLKSESNPADVWESLSDDQQQAATDSITNITLEFGSEDRGTEPASTSQDDPDVAPDALPYQEKEWAHTIKGFGGVVLNIELWQWNHVIRWEFNDDKVRNGSAWGVGIPKYPFWEFGGMVSEDEYYDGVDNAYVASGQGKFTYAPPPKVVTDTVHPYSQVEAFNDGTQEVAEEGVAAAGRY